MATRPIGQKYMLKLKRHIRCGHRHFLQQLARLENNQTENPARLSAEIQESIMANRQRTETYLDMDRELRRLDGAVKIASLHLDIFTPSNPESVNLPVLLSIHGGGYTLGNGANAAAGLNFVNRSDGGMIFVTIQYRLGGYGFLSPDAIKEDGAPNARLLDERAATEWITIRGGSAGGGAVVNQLTMYGGQPSPSFRAAIAEYPWIQGACGIIIQDAA
ncbi:unnamed protein product [Aureobasidium pullulans]|nr:unnamed protein product [Aureobasidium pullulans]